MTTLSALRREALLLRRDRAFLIWVLLALLLSSLSVAGGLREVAEQRETIDRLLADDRADRQDALSRQDDWGMAAYYSFHLTYDPPSNFAFAALGVRDQEPWKHRVRMLALEGQIYERDAGNPVLALTGRFDFAFFAAFVLPLILIVLLHDLKSGERGAGRFALLITTSGRAASPWRARASIRSAAVFLAAALPLLAGCVLSATSPGTTVLALLCLAGYVLLWTVIALAMAGLERGSSVILASLLGVWVLAGVVLPAAGKRVIDQLVPIPAGADILLTQREAVNDAWDLPKAETMDAFMASHPQWEPYAAIEQSFEWKWYYAFQQVGDEKTEGLSLAYRDGRLRRDELAGNIAWLAPPALLERALQRLAATDLRAHRAYEDRVRAFHGQLRTFYYGKLFPETAFEAAALSELPQFEGEGSAP